LFWKTTQFGYRQCGANCFLAMLLLRLLFRRPSPTDFWDRPARWFGGLFPVGASPLSTFFPSCGCRHRFFSSNLLSLAVYTVPAAKKALCLQELERALRSSGALCLDASSFLQGFCSPPDSALQPVLSSIRFFLFSITLFLFSTLPYPFLSRAHPRGGERSPSL